MFIQNIIRNKFNLNWSTTFSYSIDQTDTKLSVPNHDDAGIIMVKILVVFAIPTNTKMVRNCLELLDIVWEVASASKLFSNMGPILQDFLWM